MSIIGSAWGEETVAPPFVVTPTDETVQGIVQNGISNEHVSITFSGIESIKAGSYKDENDNPLPCFKFNGSGNDKLTISPIGTGVTITSVTLRGISSKRDMKVNGAVVESEGGTGNWTIVGTPGDDGTVYFEYYSSNAYIYTITVEYTYTTDYNTNANASVLSIGSGSATATNANIFTYKGCAITNNTYLFDCVHDGDYVTLKVNPTENGKYSFSSKIASPFEGCTIKMQCNGEDVTDAERSITSNGTGSGDLDWATGDTYTWYLDLVAGQEYEIKLLCAKVDGYNGNGYLFNVYPMTIAKETTTNTVKAGINHFNYIDGTFPATRNNFLGLNFWFGGSAVVDGYITVRLGNGGSMTIQSANSKNIRKVVFQKVSDDKMYTVGSLTSDVAGTFALDDENNLVWTTTADATQVVFTSAADNTYIKNFDISVEDENTELYTTKVTPTISFNNPTTTVEAGQTVTNVAKVQVNGSDNENFRVKYESSNTNVATVGEYTGIVTAVGAGTATITASYDGRRLKDNGTYESTPGSNAGYNAAESVTYDITVTEAAGGIEYVENKATSLFVEDFNYFNNTSVSNGLNRTGVRGFNLSFTGDAMSPKAIVADGVDDYISMSSRSSTAVSMTVAIYDPTRDEDGNAVANAITNVKFICQDTPNTEGVVVTDQSGNTVEGTWGTKGSWYLWAATAGLNSTATSLTFTFPTGSTGATLGFKRIEVGTTATPIFRDNTHDGVKQKDMTPSMSFANASIRFEKGTQTEINNALTVKANDNVIENFKVTYTITDANGDAVANATADAQSGKVTLPADLAAGTYTVKAAFVVSSDRSSNTLYKEAAGSYTINIFEYSTPYTIDGGTLTMNDITGAAYIREGQTASVTNLGIVFEGEDYTVTNGRYEVNKVNYDVAHAATNGITLNGNIPSEETGEGSGGYLVLTPAVNGTLTLDACYFDKQTITVVDSEGNIAGSYKHDGNKYNYYGTKDFVLRGGKTYYVYNNGEFSLQIRAISFAEIEETVTTVEVANFNYDRGPSGLANNNRDIDRTVGGFVFDFNQPSYQGIKVNNTSQIDFLTKDEGTGELFISLDNNNKDNVISKIVVTGANLDKCTVENGTIALTDDNKSATITVTDGTQPVVIQGGGFSVTQFDITTDFKPVFEKIKPVITLGAESIDVVINEHNATNALNTWNDKFTLKGSLSVDQSFFALTYKITENGTGSTVYNDYQTYLQGTVKAGTNMGSETVTVSFAGNDYYEPVSVTFNVNVISLPLTNGHTWDFQTNTTVAANDAAIENGVYTDCTEADGLMFDASVGSLEKKDGYLLMDKNGKAAVTIPGVKAGQIVTFNVESESNLTEHGIVCTSGNAELKSGVKSNLQGYFSFVVTEDGEVTFAESDGNGAMKIYSITVSKENPGEHPEVKFLDENGNEITNRPVQWYHEDDASGEHLHNHYTLITSTKYNVAVYYEIIKGSEIATIVDNQVVFNGTGHVVVRAYTMSQDKHADGNDAIMHLQHRKLATVTWTYNGADFNNMTLEHNTGSELTDPTAATTATDATLAYRSSNTNVAVVDANGDITVTGAGETIITAYHASTNDYIGAYATFTLKVKGDISFYSTPNANLVTLGSKIGTMINKPNKAEGKEGWVILDKEEDVTIKYSAEGIVTAEFTEPSEMGGNGLLTVKSVDNNEFVGETVDVLLTVKMTKVAAEKEDGDYVPLEDDNGNVITAMYSTLYSVTIAPAGQLNFSWNEASGKMIVGDHIIMPEITGSANQNTNMKYPTLDKNGGKNKSEQWKYPGIGLPQYTIIKPNGEEDTDGEYAKIFYSADGNGDYYKIGQGLWIYAIKVGTIRVRATDMQTQLYADYTLEIVESESYDIAEAIEFPYTWDFTGPVDDETKKALASDKNYWFDSGNGDFRNWYGYYNNISQDENGDHVTGKGRAYKNFTADTKMITSLKGLKVQPGTGSWGSQQTRFVIKTGAKDGEPHFGNGGTTRYLLPTAVNVMPNEYKYFVKIRANSGTKFEVFGAAKVTDLSTGNEISGELKDGWFSNKDYIFCIEPAADKSTQLIIGADNIDIYWIAASTEQTHPTTVNGYPEGDPRRTAMATYTYGKALDYSLSKEVNPGLRTYIASEISKTGKKLNVKLTETTDALREGEGVILRSDNAQAFYMIADAENEKEYTAPEYRVDNYLVGTVDDATIYREDQAEANAVNYILSLKYTTEDLGGVYQSVKDFGFYKLYSASITSKAKRSYLQVPFGDEGYGQAGVNPEEGASAEALGIIFEDEFGEVTGIIEVETGNSANANSNADGYYNLSGVRINKPTQKGVYIHNGKKIVVK